MAKIIWTEPALLDLNDIAGYIALDKKSAANKLVEKVFKRVDLLSDAPNSGRVPLELKGLKYREVIVGPCRVFYRVNGKEVVVLYIMRSERQLRRYILEDRNNSGN